MAGRGSGVVVFLSGTPSRGTVNTSAIGAAFGALESLTRSLAVDLGPHGVRVVCVRTMGMAETRVMQQTYELGAKTMGAPRRRWASPQSVEASPMRSGDARDTTEVRPRVS
jgi:NAD(P)-dependent dehydrogenase (short-subunit alcohol dehydrogenase family)